MRTKTLPGCNYCRIAIITVIRTDKKINPYKSDIFNNKFYFSYLSFYLVNIPIMSLTHYSLIFQPNNLVTKNTTTTENYKTTKDLLNKFGMLINKPVKI